MRFELTSSFFSGALLLHVFYSKIKSFKLIPYSVLDFSLKWFKYCYITVTICLHTVCSIWPINRSRSGATTPGQSAPWEQRQWTGTSHSPNLLDWSFAISWFNVMDRTLFSGGFTPLQRCSLCILKPLMTELICGRDLPTLTFLCGLFDWLINWF